MMGIFCTTVPDNNFVRRYKWELKRRRMRRGLRMTFPNGKTFTLDVFKYQKAKELERLLCENEGKTEKEVIMPPCRLRPPPLPTPRRTFLSRFKGFRT